MLSSSSIAGGDATLSEDGEVFFIGKEDSLEQWSTMFPAS